MWNSCGILPQFRRRGGTTLRMWRAMAITPWLGGAAPFVRRNPLRSRTRSCWSYPPTPGVIAPSCPEPAETGSYPEGRAPCQSHPPTPSVIAPPARACRDRLLSRRTSSLPGSCRRQASVDSNEIPSSGNKIVFPGSCRHTSSADTWPPPSTRWRCRVQSIPSWILRSMGSRRTT